MMGDDRLDAVLSAPLPAVDDAGFSGRVVARGIIAQERRRNFEIFSLLAAFGVLLALLPLTTFATAIENVTIDLGSSVPVAMAALAIVLTSAYARQIAD